VERAEAGLAAARARHPVRLTRQELAWLTRAGADIRAVFDAPATTNSQRKQLIRAVISEITLTIDRQAGTCHALITWQGTATSSVTFPLPKQLGANVIRVDPAGGAADITGGRWPRRAEPLLDRPEHRRLGTCPRVRRRHEVPGVLDATREDLPAGASASFPLSGLVVTALVPDDDVQPVVLINS
jgi:hypothetical protein